VVLATLIVQRRQREPGPEGAEWLHACNHGSATLSELAQQVRDPEGVEWRKRNQGCACCQDQEEEEKGVVEEERLRDCLLLGLERCRKDRQGSRAH
jgi:uncharacterized Zn finger protein